MVHRLRGMAGRPFVAFLAWAGRLWEGGLCGSWGCAQLMDQDGSGKHHFEPVTHHPSLLWDVLFPEFSYVGHNRTSENISNRFNSCGFFSASPLLLGLCCVSFSGSSDSSFISWATKGSHCMAVMLLPVIPLLRLCQAAWWPWGAGVRLPPPGEPLWLRLGHVAVWGDINCC